MTRAFNLLPPDHPIRLHARAVRVCLALMLLMVFWFDSRTPLGFAHGMLYVPVVFLALLTLNTRILIIVTSLAAILTFFGVAISEGPVFATPVVVGNRLVAVTIILISGVIAYGTLRIAAAQLSQQQKLERQEQFAQLADALPIIIWMADANGEVDFLNQALYDYVGLEKGSNGLPGRWLDLVHPDDRDRTTNKWMQCVLEKHPYNIEFRIRRADGHYGYFLIRAVLVKKGQTERWYGSAIDLDNYRRLQLQLAHSQRLEAIGQLTGGMAHDFNNLLTVVLGNADLLSDSLESDPPLKELADTIIQAAERGAALNQSLLAFARRQALSPEKLDIGRLVQGMQPLLARSLDETIVLTVHIPPEPLIADVDRAQLESALLNLTLNARDAMPQGGELSISVSHSSVQEHSSQDDQLLPGDYVLITVKDNGHGIPAEIQGKVFDPFFSTKQHGKGSGLGLSMAFGFFKQSGGHMQLESMPDQGTSFYLYLPIKKGTPQETPTSAQTGAAHGVGTVLLVEDEELVRRYSTRILQDAGYNVLAVDNAVEAMKVLNKAPEIQLLFTDIVMPGGMTGVELAIKARSLYPSLPVIYTSGHNNNAALRQGSLAPHEHYIAKPYRREDLLALIAEVVNRPLS